MPRGCVSPTCAGFLPPTLPLNGSRECATLSYQSIRDRAIIPTPPSRWRSGGYRPLEESPTACGEACPRPNLSAWHMSPGLVLSWPEPGARVRTVTPSRLRGKATSVPCVETVDSSPPSVGIHIRLAARWPRLVGVPAVEEVVIAVVRGLAGASESRDDHGARRSSSFGWRRWSAGPGGCGVATSGRRPCAGCPAVAGDE
jgi:hypothetical protein